MPLDSERRFASRRDAPLERADDPYALRRRAVLEPVEELVLGRAGEWLIASGLDPADEHPVYLGGRSVFQSWRLYKL